MISITKEEAFWQSTEDWHTAGEPFRIVHHPPAGYLTPGLTVAEQRFSIIQQSGSKVTPVKDHPLDLLRQSLCHEPRGHADMYGCFITPPNDSGAHFGALFWHKDGFSTACGHGTIALGYWAVAKGLVENLGDGTADVVIDVPSGRVIAKAECKAGHVQHVDFVNVPSYQISESFSTAAISVESTMAAVDRTNFLLTAVYGGAIYLFLDIRHMEEAYGKINIEAKHHQLFIDVQRKILASLRERVYPELPSEIYGVCFFEHISDSPEAITQRSVTVFADGQIDRSPCGSATSARLAMLLNEGKVNEERKLIHESIIGTRFEAFVDETLPSRGGFRVCIPRVRGEARLVARSEFLVDPADPVYPGFVLR